MSENVLSKNKILKENKTQGICKKIKEEYFKGTSYRELYKKYDSYKVQLCLNLDDMFINFMERLGSLSDKDIDNFVYLIKKHRELKSNKNMKETIKQMNKVNLDKLIKFILYIFSSKSYSKNIEVNPEVIPEEYILRKFNNNALRISLRKPIMKNMLMLILYYLYKTNKIDYYLDELYKLIKSNKKRQFYHLKNNIRKLSYKRDFYDVFIQKLNNKTKKEVR